MFCSRFGSSLQAPNEMIHWESSALCWAEFVHGPEQSPVFSTWCGCPQDLGSRACRPTWHSPCGQAQHPAVAMLGPCSGLSGSSSGVLGAFASCCVQALVWVIGAKQHSGLTNITYCKKNQSLGCLIIFSASVFSSSLDPAAHTDPPWDHNCISGAL